MSDIQLILYLIAFIATEKFCMMSFDMHRITLMFKIYVLLAANSVLCQNVSEQILLLYRGATVPLTKPNVKKCSR